MIRVVGKGRWLYKVFPRGVISNSPPLINGVVMRFVCGSKCWIAVGVGEFSVDVEVIFSRCGSGIAPRK